MRIGFRGIGAAVLLLALCPPACRPSGSAGGAALGAHHLSTWQNRAVGADSYCGAAGPPHRRLPMVSGSTSTGNCSATWRDHRYAVEWVDENPFERREISVIAKDGLGRESTDKVILEPFEITEAADVSSVLLEAAVQDKAGRFVKDLTAPSFTLLEDGVPQALDIVQQEKVGATFAMLIDSSASMARRMDFVQRTAATLALYMKERDQMVIAPFARSLGL